MGKSMKNWHGTYGSLLGLGAFLLFIAGTSHAADALGATDATGAVDATSGQNFYSTPEKAVDALIFASRKDHPAELIKILGPESEKLVNSGDDVADQESRARFVAAYDKAHKIETQSDSVDVLTVGDEEWPVPIPLVHEAKGWRFDTAKGEDEILNRRIGRNELNVIEVCRTFVDAQREFAALHPLPGDKREFAQKFTSTEGAHDGLYWAVKDGEAQSPFGPLIASAAAEGYSDTTALSQHEPYHGYYYKILTSQGSHATGGEGAYILDGHMTGGFALIAFPAKYGDSGVMSFIVNENGIVYENNLGPDTISTASAMTQYDPDESWKVVQ
jgi:hypothetical protein